ncbi:hypothetical protein [Algoriphagus sp.]|uniref:hypothetical protein n=1 Tax=Algoriphagus sp. TaxID=1872435 RepID=UPI003F7145B7
MSQFHLKRLKSGVRTSHQVPLREAWTFAINKQARLILLPLFRQLIVDWYEEDGVKFPMISDVAGSIYRRVVDFGDFPVDELIPIRKIMRDFVQTLKPSDKELLKFYFLGSELEENRLFQHKQNPDLNSLEEDLVEDGRIFLEQVSAFTDEQLESYVLQELTEIENIISSGDCLNSLEVGDIIRINENFSDYLDMPYGEIALIEVPGEEWDYWERVYEEERKTIGKKLNSDEGLEWLECWLLPDGNFKVKGNLNFPGARDKVAIKWIHEDMESVLVMLETRLMETYGIREQDINYTFFTKRKNLENVDLSTGMNFFKGQIEQYGADDFESGIKYHLVREVRGDHQIWGAQTSIIIKKQFFELEDQMDLVSAWLIYVDKEVFQLESQLSMREMERVIQTLLDKINADYLKVYGS